MRMARRSVVAGGMAAAGVTALGRVARASENADWAAVVDAARKEGSLTVSTGLESPVVRAIFRNFEAKYGVRVDSLVGRPSEVRERIRVAQIAGRQEVDVVLRESGYAKMPANLAIGGVPFRLQNAYVAGAGYLDLVLVMDVCDEGAGIQETYWLLERVARALDNAESRRPLTSISACANPPSASAADGLLRLGRVLFVGSSQLTVWAGWARR